MSEDKFEATPESGVEWEFLLRNRRIAMVVLGLAVFIGGVLALVVRPVYESSVTLAVTQVAAAGPIPGEAAPGDPVALQATLQRQKAILASPEFAGRLLARLDDGARADLASGPTGSWWERAWAKTRPAGISTINPSDALATRLSVRSEPRSSIIEMRAVAFDAVVAAAVANGAADLYIQENAEASRARVETYRQRVASQLEESEQRLSEQISSARAIEGQNRLDALLSRKSVLERQLAILENEAAAAGAPAPRAAAMAGGAAPSTPSPAAAHLADLEAKRRTLLLTLGEKHPDVIALDQQIADARVKVDSENRRTSEGLSGREPLGARGSEARARMERIRRDLSQMEVEILGYALERQKIDAEAASMKKLIERQAIASPMILDVQLVDRARPSRTPSYPRPLSFLGYGLLLGLVFGVGAAWIADHARSTVQTPEELKAAIHLPFLGIVPLVRELSDGSLLQSIQNPHSGLADSLAVVRANIMFGPAAETTRVIHVTGPGPGEGKSTVAAGLALAFARTGARTLLVDADLRRPSIHGILRLPQKPGLTEMLSADWNLRPPIRATSIPGLDVLVAGAARRYSAEHLGSDEMRTFLERMRGEYDRLILNSPPVLGLSDALVLGTLADGILLVCSAGHTPIPAARNAVEALSGLRTPTLGFVLNRSERRKNQYYGGSYYTGPERRGARLGPGARDGAGRTGSGPTSGR